MRLIESGRYLPTFMRDFHDQKDLFKSISEWAYKDNPNQDDISWVQGHIYVIDIFLHFMALHGYILKKTQSKEKTYNIYDTLKQYSNKRVEVLQTLFKR